jgi:hypothetical protein
MSNLLHACYPRDAQTSLHEQRTRLLNKIRVAFVALPELMGGGRCACQADSDIEIAPSIGSLSQISVELKQCELGMLIVAITSDSDARLALRALSIQPRAQVLLITVKDAVAEMYALHPGSSNTAGHR